LAVFAAVPTGVLAQGGHASESAQAAQVRALNNSVLQLHGQMQENASGAAWIRGQAAAVIAQRAAALTALIEKDPRAALSFAFSPELLADLATKFPQSATQLESHATLSGQLEHWIEDGADLKTSRSYFLLKAGGRTLNVHFAGSEPVVKSGELLQATGVVIGSAMAVETSSIVPSIAATASTSGPTFAATLAATNFVREQRGPMLVLLLCALALTMLGRWVSSCTFREQIRRYAVCTISFAILVSNPTTTYAQSACSTTGVQQVAVLVVTFPGIAVPNFSPSLYDQFFGPASSLTGYWQEASYGVTSATGNVFGPFTLSGTYSCSNVRQFMDDSIAAAAASGVDFNIYKRVNIVFPDMNPSCG